jgi:hypothetical protein
MDINESAGAVDREEQGIEIPIRNQFLKPAMAPDGVTPAMMRVAGSFSERYRSAMQDYQEWVREELATLKDGEEIDPKKRDVKWIELVLAKIILGWTGLTAGGTDFPYSEANAVTLLTPRPWIRDDVEKASVAHERFFGEPSTRSRAA